MRHLSDYIDKVTALESMHDGVEDAAKALVEEWNIRCPIGTKVKALDEETFTCSKAYLKACGPVRLVHIRVLFTNRYATEPWIGEVPITKLTLIEETTPCTK